MSGRDYLKFKQKYKKYEINVQKTYLISIWINEFKGHLWIEKGNWNLELKRSL